MGEVCAHECCAFIDCMDKERRDVKLAPSAMRLFETEKERKT
jgi:hypothetical protein